jgi:hypothetical protein
MNANQRPWIVLAVLIVVALLLAFLAINYLPHGPGPLEPRPTYPPPPPGDIELYYTIKVVLTTVNAALLIFLFSAYLGVYRKIRSDFTIGLMVFSLVLLLYALSSNPLLQWVFGFRAFGLGPFAMLPDLFTCVGSVVLVYLTFRY